jgi:hypothetical protein
LVPCVGSGNESEDWEKGLNGLHVEGERLYVAETRVSWLESGESGEMVKWMNFYRYRVGQREWMVVLLEGGGEEESEQLGIGRTYMWEAGGRLQ